ncbi:MULTISPECIES: histidinol-phosphate transaminase [unclassified Spirosoma]|uniref:pyridoxal phosphate-dependent aminotransferase n=1 Tax=unclassified Spirosoma TaxID=2621999 RepID=UPI00095F02D7|nr:MULTISPECIES: histidinol-phosphate transaminase [unclassified Spirosoma]MBN8821915.1 histidinol-phosphate aminotransferase family protein [Spirosoma sp.]OJW80605.1 MAG: aminotransferase class I/II [Spirosoma sp. 48-14]
MSINRRDWLRASLLSGLSMAAAPAAFCEPEQEMPLGYKAPKGPLKARLSANENPYGPSPKVLKTITEAAPDGYLYAMEHARKFRKLVADTEGVPEEYVLLGAGSGELLTAASLWAAYRPNAGRTIVAPDPTFDQLPRAAMKHGVNIDRVPLVAADGYDINLNKLNERVNSQTGMVYLCNPNNPTAIIVDPSKLRAFCESVGAKTPILVDEAYIDYTPDPKAYSMVDMVKKGSNVIITKTFSKVHGFAGLRTGYMIAKPELLEQISKFATGGGCISMTTLRAAMVSLQDKEFINYSLGKAKESKDFLLGVLKQTNYEPLPSGANFVMFPIRMKGEDFVTRMMDQGVSIRQWKFDGQYWCRVSLGTMDQMKAFADALKMIS